METLKELVEIFKDMPTLAVIAVFIYFMYKATIVGSIYAVIKLGIDRWHSYATTPKHELKKIEIDETARVSSLVIKGCMDDLIAQLHRLKNTKHYDDGYESDYIHRHDVEWLREAINEKKKKERGAESLKPD